MAEKRKRDDAGEQGGKASKNPKINSDPALCDSSDGEDVEQTGKYHYAMICSSNVNRSCAAHKKLKKAGLIASSYGAGAQVKMPGIGGPRVFPFGTPYDTIYKSLEQENKEYYIKNGMLPMMDRDRRIKTAPERWQDSDIVGVVHVAICFEERIYELVEEDLGIREAQEFEPLHIVNIETKDNPEAAAKSADLALKLCQQIEEQDDISDDLSEIIEAFEKEHNVSLRDHPALDLSVSMSKTLFACAVAVLLLSAAPTNGNKLLSHLGLRDQCIQGPGGSTRGTYGPFRTNFYFPKVKNCQERYHNGQFRTKKNSCIQLDIANKVRGLKLTRFIDVARIRNEGRISEYYFECQGGLEVCNSHYRNGDKETLCYLLNKANPCQGFGDKYYRVNGCSKPDCEDITDMSDPRLDRMLQLKVYVDVDGYETESKATVKKFGGSES
eukprot:g10661.t1